MTREKLPAGQRLHVLFAGSVEEHTIRDGDTIYWEAAPDRDDNWGRLAQTPDESGPLGVWALKLLPTTSEDHIPAKPSESQPSEVEQRGGIGEWLFGAGLLWMSGCSVVLALPLMAVVFVIGGVVGVDMRAWARTFPGGDAGLLLLFAVPIWLAILARVAWKDRRSRVRDTASDAPHQQPPPR